MGDFSPISVGCFAAIHTDVAVSLTATDGSAAARTDASEISVKDSLSPDFFRVKPWPC